MKESKFNMSNEKILNFISTLEGQISDTQKTKKLSSEQKEDTVSRLVKLVSELQEEIKFRNEISIFYSTTNAGKNPGDQCRQGVRTKVQGKHAGLGRGRQKIGRELKKECCFFKIRL